PHIPTPFPYTTLFRSVWKPEIAVPQRKPGGKAARAEQASVATSARTMSNLRMGLSPNTPHVARTWKKRQTCQPEFRRSRGGVSGDRKSTRLNSSHVAI